MSEEIDVPISCLRDDNLKIDKNYELFLDHLSNGNSLGPPFEDDNEEETRNRKIDMIISGNEKKPINENRGSQQRKRKAIGFDESEKSSRQTRESIRQRDNRLAERRKRKIASELEAIQQDNEATESKVETLPCSKLGNEKKPNNKNRVSQQRKRKAIGFEAEMNSRSVPLATTRESIRQRDNRLAERRKRKISEIDAARLSWAATESKVETLPNVPLFRTKEDIRRDYRARRRSVSKVETLRDVPLVRTKVAVQRDSRTSRVVPVERVNNKVTEIKSVDETSRKEEESVAVVDKDYMSYLTWLVDSLKDSTNEPVPSVQNTRKESTNVVHDKDLLVKVKVEPESWSDDDDDDDGIIAVSDFPFSDGESTPFVVSKSKIMIDLEDESAEDDESSSSSCWFKEKLMDVLKKPYDEEELLRLSGEASVKKPVIRCRELRKGRESSYKTDELGQSYLERFSDFDKEYKLVDGDDDKARLELLRGFFFYLENLSHVGAFKPWLPVNKKKLQCLQP